LEADKNFGVVKDPAYPHIKSNSRTLGDHVGAGSKAQRSKSSSGQTENSLGLLIYNNIDPVFQSFAPAHGLQRLLCTVAYTILVKTERPGPHRIGSNGKDQMLQETKNTSFSAVAIYSDRGGKTTVTLYKTSFAKVRIPLRPVAPCFDVPRHRGLKDPLIGALRRVPA